MLFDQRSLFSLLRRPGVASGSSKIPVAHKSLEKPIKCFLYHCLSTFFGTKCDNPGRFV